MVPEACQAACRFWALVHFAGCLAAEALELHRWVPEVAHVRFRRPLWQPSAHSAEAAFGEALGKVVMVAQESVITSDRGNKKRNTALGPNMVGQFTTHDLYDFHLCHDLRHSSYRASQLLMYVMQGTLNWPRSTSTLVRMLPVAKKQPLPTTRVSGSVTCIQEGLGPSDA